MPRLTKRFVETIEVAPLPLRLDDQLRVRRQGPPERRESTSANIVSAEERARPLVLIGTHGQLTVPGPKCQSILSPARARIRSPTESARAPTLSS